MLPSSLGTFCIPLESGLFSDDCERLRAFCAEPSMPSRLKLGFRLLDLRDVGDLSEFTPLALGMMPGAGISTVKSLFGIGNLPTTLTLAAAVMVAVDECGESPLDDGDMLI